MIQDNDLCMEIQTASFSDNERCPRCHDTGWIILRQWENPWNTEDYHEVASPCPDCNGGRIQRATELKEQFQEIPKDFEHAFMRDFKWDQYTDEKGRHIDTAKLKQVVSDFVDHFEEWQDEGLGLYIYSKTRGSGKTFLASCICNELTETKGIICRFISCAELIDCALQKGRFQDKNTLMELEKAQVLVLDDLGVSPNSFMSDILFRLLDKRLQRKLITIATSNIKVENLKLDDRVTDRLNRMTQNIPLPEMSFRSALASATKAEFFRKRGLSA